MSTTGHENEMISVGGLKSALQKFKTNKVDGKADKTATVSTVGYNTTSKKITKTINGTTSDVVSASTIVTDGGGIKSHQSVDNKNATLAYGQQSTIATVGSTDIKVTMPAAPSSTDTKNTAGSTQKASTKLFLVGAESQAANPQTYSNSGVYVGTDGELYSSGKKVMTGGGGGTVDLGDVIIKKLSTEVAVTYPTIAQSVTIPHGLDLSEIANIQISLNEIFIYTSSRDSNSGVNGISATCDYSATKVGGKFLGRSGVYMYDQNDTIISGDCKGAFVGFADDTQPNMSLTENNIVLDNVKLGIFQEFSGYSNTDKKFILTLFIFAYK